MYKVVVVNSVEYSTVSGATTECLLYKKGEATTAYIAFLVTCTRVLY